MQDSKNSLEAVNLQNDDKLASARDVHEKNLIVPWLGLTGKEKVLEIGCGIGRFVPDIINQITSYLGLDFSTQLIELAKK